MLQRMLYPPVRVLSTTLLVLCATWSSPAQGTKIGSSSVNGGFAGAHLPGITVQAIAGQNVVGTTLQPGTVVVSGFLADTLWRGRILAVEQTAGSTIPGTFSLSQNYPNPFNPTTVVSWQLAAASNVQLRVYDVLGREVATLADKRMEAGVYTATFEGRNLASGVYFYRLEAVSAAGGERFVQTKKMLMLK